MVHGSHQEAVGVVMSMPKRSTEKPPSISEHKRRISLAHCRRLAERMLEWYRPEFEQYVRSYREYHGFDPDTLEVSNTWPEDVVDEG